jgi:hypothetical protein
LLWREFNRFNLPPEFSLGGGYISEEEKVSMRDSSLRHPNPRKTGVFWGPRLRSE